MMLQMDFGAFQLQNSFNEPGSIQNNLLQKAEEHVLH